MKKFLSLLLVLVLALSLVACGGKKVEEDPVEETKPLKVLFITEALGDNSFADASDRSMKEYVAKYGVEYQCTQLGAGGDARPALREAGANGFDIVAVGYNSETATMLDEEAETYPDTIFYMFSAPNTYEPTAKNLISGYFKSRESSFGGGLVAAAMSKTGICAFIGGAEGIGLYDWMIGYVQGVERAGGNTVYSWIGGDNPWTDPAKAKELSVALCNNYNADVFWGCAGQSGDGVFQAVRELRDTKGSDDFWALGVDADQYAVFSDNGKDDIAELIVTSCIKNPVGPVESMIKTLQAGEKVETGCMWTVGLAEGATVIAENDYYKQTAPKSVQDLYAQVKSELVAGTFEIVTAYGMSTEEWNAFLAEHTLNYVG